MKRMLILAALLIVFAGCQSTPQVDVEMHKKLAGELRDNKLYDAAVEEYRKVLDAPALTEQERANIDYLIGRIYFDDVQNYEQAAAYYVRARALDPKAGFNEELSRNLVTCLERLGRRVDARRQLDKLTNIDADTSKAGKVPVAKIGDQMIYRSQVDREIQALPAQAQKQLMTPDARKQFLHNYVAIEMLYRAAERDQMDKSPEMQRQIERARKQLVVEQYVRQKVMPQIPFDSTDVYNFYAAKKSDYDNKPYDSVKAQVFLDYQSDKSEHAYSDYIRKLAQDEHVEFYDANMEK